MLFRVLIFSLIFYGTLAQASAEKVTALQTNKTEEVCLSHSDSELQQKSPLFIFVSLSMPEAALKSLYREAQAKGAVLVLRGLQDHSIKKTAETLKRLEVSVQINPELFQQYHIESVPTFVWVQKNEVHTLRGHVSLEYAQSQFLEDA